MALLATGCSLKNPYITEIEIHQMKIEQGQIAAYKLALQMAQEETKQKGKQHIKKIEEYSLLISAYTRATGKTPEEIKKMNLLSPDDITQESKYYDGLIEEYENHVDQSYNDFFVTIKKYDIQIEALHELKMDITEKNKQMYMEASRSFAFAILGNIASKMLMP